MKTLLIATGIALCIVGSMSVENRASVSYVPCSRGTIENHASGKLKSCLLDRDFRIQEVQCLRGAYVLLYESGKLEQCVPSQRTSIGNIPCLASAVIRLYEKGTLELCTLDHRITVNNTDCEAGGQIILYENGNLKTCLQRRWK
jgi:antitoxin component YwqK of YwqJK toxin-antitoxin module